MADDDEDKLERSVAGNRLDELASAMRGAREEDPAEIEVQEPEEVDPDELIDKTPTGRQERRTERGSKRQTAREAAAAAEARADAFKEALELAARTPAAQPAPQQQGNPLAEIDARIRQNYKDTESLHSEWNAKQGKMSAQEEQALRDRAIDLDVQKTTLIADRRDRMLSPQRIQEEHSRKLAARYPDIYANRQAMQYAAGEFNKRLARGEPDNEETHDTAMEEARQVILGKRPKPDAIERQRSSGMGAGLRQGQRAEAPVRISMPPGSAMDKMARAAYPNEEPAVARQKWANKNGKAFLASRSRDDR